MDIRPYIDQLKKLKGDILYKYLKVDQVRDYLMKLSERDRKIVIASSIAVAFLLAFTVYSAVSHSLTKKEENIQKKIENFDKIVKLGDDYQSLYGILKKIETLIKRTPPDFSLMTRLENLAKTSGIKIDSMKPKPTSPNDFYKETQVELKIRDVTLKTFVNFLYEIENSKEFLKITSVQLRPSYSKQMYLDVTFSVSTFSPAKKS